MRISVNHNSLGCEQPTGLDVNQSLIVFLPIYISCVGVTGSEGITCHVHATQMAGHRSPTCICSICACVYSGLWAGLLIIIADVMPVCMQVHVHVHVHVCVASPFWKCPQRSLTFHMWNVRFACEMWGDLRVCASCVHIHDCTCASTSTYVCSCIYSTHFSSYAGFHSLPIGAPQRHLTSGCVYAPKAHDAAGVCPAWITAVSTPLQPPQQPTETQDSIASVFQS